MRIFTILCFVLVSGCDQGSTGPGQGFFDYLLIVRQGGGDKSFTVKSMPTVGRVEISVSRYQFRDTLVQFQCGPDPSSTDAFNALNNALYGGIVITGDFHQSSLPTGTWAFLYMVRDGERHEITNTELRNKLLGFEALVQRHFPPVR